MGVVRVVDVEEEFAAITAALTRRGLLAGGLALAALGAAGCAADESAAESAAASPATRVVATVNGDVEVPLAPTRVAALSYDAPFQLRSLGVTPVAGYDYSSLYEQFDADEIAFLSGFAALGTWGEPDLEKLAAATPDLIVGLADEVPAGLYDQLSVIAPTALFQPSTRGDWQFVVERYAAATATTAALDAARTAFEQRIAELRVSYAAQLTGYRWVSYSFGDTDGQFSVQYPTGATGALMAELGMTFGSVVGDRRPDAGYLSYSTEQVDLLADVTAAIHPLAADGSEFPAIAAFRESRLWRTLRLREHDTGLVTFYDVAGYDSAARALDELEHSVLRPLT